MHNFDWSDQFATGDDRIDRQHKELFLLLKQLINPKTHESRIDRFLCIYKHFGEHFQQEELLTKRIAYFEYAEQVTAHNMILEKLNHISEQLTQEQIKQDDLLQFLEYCKNHITSEDIKVKNYMSELDVDLIVDLELLAA